jgi:hypothetical protein
MHQALQIQTRVDQTLVNAIRTLKPLLGHRSQVIPLDLDGSIGAEAPGDADRSDGPGSESRSSARLTLDEFLATRPAWPKGRPPLTLEEIEEGIIQGALNSADTMVFQARIGEDYLLRLPVELPAGLRVRVTIEPLPEAPLEPGPGTIPLGAQLRAIRQRALAQGIPLQSVGAILEEMYQGRAEASERPR